MLYPIFGCAIALIGTFFVYLGFQFLVTRRIMKWGLFEEVHDVSLAKNPSFILDTIVFQQPFFRRVSRGIKVSHAGDNLILIPRFQFISNRLLRIDFDELETVKKIEYGYCIMEVLKDGIILELWLRPKQLDLIESLQGLVTE